jgi:hypothetical protein
LKLLAALGAATTESIGPKEFFGNSASTIDRAIANWFCSLNADIAFETDASSTESAMPLCDICCGLSTRLAECLAKQSRQ